MYQEDIEIVKQSGTQRMTRQCWLDAALGMVVDTGVERLKVQDLAASRGATTGSLYWHFRNRRSLAIALVQHWVEYSTERIAERVLDLDGTAEETLLALMVMVQENAATSGDIAIRSFAAHDEEAARIVVEADTRREEIVSSIFRRIGFSGDELRMRTQMFLCYEACERFVVPDQSPAHRARLLRARHALYCRQP